MLAPIRMDQVCVKRAKEPDTILSCQANLCNPAALSQMMLHGFMTSRLTSQENRKTWETWEPIETNCLAGFGMVDAEADGLGIPPLGPPPDL